MSKILVIDDDPTVLKIIQRALQPQGHEVIVAENGRAGLEQAQTIRPALIICDWMMPYLDGLEVCRQVKADVNLSTTFFILLTSRVGLEDRIEGLDTGADDFLAKPIEISELQARVRAGLRLHQVSRALQIQKDLLEAELAEAASYVRALLPNPLSGTEVSINAKFMPSRQLGGDCFDYFWLDPDYLVMYLLDVSGHGLAAALPSILVLNLLRSQSLPNVNFYQPQDVLKGLNDAFQMSSQNEKYFTIWYGVYSRSKRQLTYASAGHPPAILLTPERTAPKVQSLRTPALPIGMLPEATFTVDRCSVPTGSTLYVFSDGIYEIAPEASVWGLESFIQLLHHSSFPSIEQVLAQVQQINGGDTFQDDVSLMQVTFR
ncbi:MAG: SpoIIE family protein phosphatase [Elainella sp. Prado103]|jgi:sigma-B regulation protein RsbU (phosphoserine phosphatase)|nr:SpoIIE family protein phosphatase [Elainella sp. Prado103]